MKKSFYTLGLLLFVCFISKAQEGEYDLSFAGVGYKFIKSAHLTTPQTGFAIAVQPDGKIVTAGPGRGLFNNGPVFMITRQLTNGQLDPGFGNGGIVYLDPAVSGEDGGGTAAYGVAITADGKIVVAGGVEEWHDFSPSSFGTAIVRLNANGTPDNSFSGDGILILKLSVPNIYEAARDVALQTDGRIVISGFAHDGTKSVMAVARINTDGTLDNSFNATGLLFVNFPFAAQGLGVKIQPDGKILSVGKAMNAAGNYDYALVRINANGSYDNSFDGDGKWTRDFNGGMDEATDVDSQPNGKLIISGTASIPALTPTLVRLNADGSYDNSFDGDGVRPIFIAPGNTGQSVIAQPDGRIMWLITTSTVYFLVKLNSDGSPYAPFSFYGVGVYNYSGQGDAYDIALQADGKIVTSGFGANGLAVPSSPEFPNVGRTVSRILNSSGTPLITITCPASLTVNTGINAVDNCIGLAPGLFAELNLETPYTFSTTGATVSSGSQSAGPYFNRGVTTVTYTSVIDPSKSCSFSVTVVDAKLPVLNCTNEVILCRTSNNTYTIPQLTASDNCGIQSTQYSISGATTRNGSGTNASGLFNPGASTITWTVTDISGITAPARRL